MSIRFGKVLTAAVFILVSACKPATPDPDRLTNLACYDGQPCMSTDGQFIAMVSTQSGERHIWIYDMNDKTREPLTMNEGSDEGPCFSPDNRTIAFSSFIEGQRDLWLIEQEGQLTRVTTTDTADEFSPCWTSDGTGIIFVRRDSSGYRLCRMEVRNYGTVVTILQDTAALDRPAVAGSKLFFQKKESGRWLIFQTDVTGQDTKRFSDGRANVRHPAVSANGRHVAFVSDASGHDEVYVSMVDFYKPVAITRSGTSHAFPAWTPGGTGLLWEETSNWNIKAIDVESQEDTVLVGHPANDRDPVVTPDGRWIIFASDRTGHDQLYALDFRTGSTMSLTSGDFVHTDPDVTGDRILFTSNRTGRFNIFNARLLANESGLRMDSVVQMTDDAVAARQGRWARNGLDIVFVTGRKGNADVWIKRAHPAREEAVTVDGRTEADPSMGVGDAVVLFAADWANRWSLWSAPTKGGLPLPLTKDKTLYGWDRCPVLSPDGQQILFTRSWYDDADIWLMRADGGERSTRTLTKDNTDQETQGRWFPDGRRVIFQAGNNTDIWMLDVSQQIKD